MCLISPNSVKYCLVRKYIKSTTWTYLILYFILSCHFSTLGDREWVPDSSLSAHADNAVALGVLQVAQNPPPNVKQQKKGKISYKIIVPHWWLTLLVS
jgi:hypothetical protein